MPPKPFEPSQSDSLPHSEPGSVAYSDSFVGAESAKTGSSRRESDVPSEALSVGEQQQPQISSGVAGKDEASESVRYSDTFDQAGKDEASDSVRYSDTFNQAGNSEPVASVATESGDGTNARWDEEVTSAMERSATSATLQAPARPAGTDGWDGVPEANVTGEGRDVKGRHLDLTGLRPEASWGQVIETHGAEVLGKEIFGESTGEVTGVLIGEITGEEESVEELPEEWSEESTGVAREQAEKDPALKSASLDPLTRAFDATEVSARGQFQDAASAAVTGPEKPEGVPAGSAKPAGRQEVRRLSEAVASEPDEYSDSFASEADVEDDVSSVPIRDTWRDDVAGEGGDEAGESGRAVAALGAAEGLEGSKDGLGGFEEGLEDGVSAWETKESPGAVPGASMFATLKRPRRNVPGTAEKDGMAESFEEADRIENEITGVESLEEVEEELEFDEDGFEVRAENGEEAGVKTGGADVGGTGNSLMSKREGSASDEIGNEVGKLRGVEKERLVKAADGVLEDLVAAEVEGESARTASRVSCCALVDTIRLRPNCGKRLCNRKKCGRVWQPSKGWTLSNNGLSRIVLICEAVSRACTKLMRDC